MPRAKPPPRANPIRGGPTGLEAVHATTGCSYIREIAIDRPKPSSRVPPGFYEVGIRRHVTTPRCVQKRSTLPSTQEHKIGRVSNRKNLVSLRPEFRLWLIGSP